MEVAIAIVGIVADALATWLVSRHYYQRAETSTAAQFDRLRHLVATPRNGDEGAPVEFAAVAYTDVTNDGRNKLLIQHHQSQNARALKVYDFRDLQFELIAELGTSLPAGFTVGDLDDDGQVEVATIDRDSEHSLYRADPAHVELLYRWDDGGFKVINRRPAPRPGEEEWAPRWYTGPIGPEQGYCEAVA